jgi:hypothetical protein
MQSSKNKIDAIYELRSAAEEKARAEARLSDLQTPQARDVLLDAQLQLEEKTLQAIEVCHECGHEHAPGTGHGILREGNVVRLKLVPRSQADPQRKAQGDEEDAP